MITERLRAQLLPVFLEELEGQVEQFTADLPSSAAVPVDEKQFQSLFRIAHTLKGAAHAVGLTPIERVCRSLEVILTIAGDGRTTIAPDHFLFLVASAEALRDAGARLRAGQELTHSPVAALAARGPR